MNIGGLQKMTLLDFPGKVACTVFLQGCNFRCPFCHNSSLVYGQEEGLDRQELLAFLQKRKGLLDGVAITGGEPLLHKDLAPLLADIRGLGFAVKVDTNGSFPEHLARLIDEGLVDYVAMDIKNRRSKYAETAGVAGFLPQVEESAALLRQNRVPYEFRTTVVDELHQVEDFAAIGRWLAGAERYFLQQFTDSGSILSPGLHSASPEKTRQCLHVLKTYIPAAQLRGQ